MRENLFIGGIVLVCTFAIGLCGFGIGQESFKDEAVEVGHAEYYIDEDHNKQFRWLEVYDG